MSASSPRKAQVSRATGGMNDPAESRIWPHLPGLSGVHQDRVANDRFQCTRCNRKQYQGLTHEDATIRRSNLVYPLPLHGHKDSKIFSTLCLHFNLTRGGGGK